jgi:hypothetical protein
MIGAKKQKWESKDLQVSEPARASDDAMLQLVVKLGWMARISY